jgi:hypothetical protein
MAARLRGVPQKTSITSIVLGPRRIVTELLEARWCANVNFLLDGNAVGDFSRAALEVCNDCLVDVLMQGVLQGWGK